MGELFNLFTFVRQLELSHHRQAGPVPVMYFQLRLIARHL